MYNKYYFKEIIYIFLYITLRFDPDLMKFFVKILSRIGSKSSIISSMSNDLPKDNASSTWFRKYL